MSFTPGPWRVHKHVHPISERLTWSVVEDTPALDAEPVCYMSFAKLDRPQDPYNAQLAACAPALLEMLKTVKAYAFLNEPAEPDWYAAAAELIKRAETLPEGEHEQSV